MYNENYVQGKVIAITGAGGGIGLQTAKDLAELGAKVVIGDVNEEGAAKGVEEIKAAGGEASWIRCDVTDYESCAAMAKFVVDTYGRIDVLIPVAGIMPCGDFDRYNIKKWTLALDINLKGQVQIIHACLPYMLKQGGKMPQVVGVSAYSALRIATGFAIYGASKAGLKMFYDDLRPEYAGRVKFTLVYPGTVAETGLKKGAGISEDDQACGAIGKFINDPNFTNTVDVDTLDQPLNEAKPELISNAICYVINQPEGAFITDIMPSFSNDPVKY